MNICKDIGAFRDIAGRIRVRHRTMAPVEGKMVIVSSQSNRKWSLKLRSR